MGYLKLSVNSAFIRNKEAFHEHFFNACQSIRDRPTTFDILQKSVTRCVWYIYIDSDGGYF